MIYNIDTLDSSALGRVWLKYRSTSNPSLDIVAALFEVSLDPYKEKANKEYYNAAYAVAEYAKNKAWAATHRENGDIAKALELEALADDIYDTLPEFARW